MQDAPPPAVERAFAEHGYLPAMPLLEPEECRALAAIDIGAEPLRNPNLGKQLWLRSRLVRNVALKPRVRAVLARLFGGEGHYLWGAQLLDRTPGQVHAWHSDLETWREEGGFVSLWIGVSGTSVETSLSAISGSHRMPRPVQADWDYGDGARTAPGGEALLAAVRERRPDAEVARIACSDGEGIFFDGRLWHGTFNSSDRPRRALLLQYGRRGVPVRRMVDFRTWPPAFDAERPPMVLSVAGEDEPVSNKHVRQEPSGKLVHPPATLAARPELIQKPGRGWTVHPYFGLETPVSRRLTCHASVLAPGRMPHLPHNHEDEEILVALDGDPVVFVPAGEDGTLKVMQLRGGDMLYYPSGLRHTIFNPGPAEARYLMFRWTGRGTEARDAKPFVARAARYRDKGLNVNLPSSRLDRLHTHFTRLAPGKQLPRHIDRYDSAFLVLRGELTSLDRTLGPGGVIFNRAGELHDTGNRGTEPCEYLVFEFHGMAD